MIERDTKASLAGIVKTFTVSQKGVSMNILCEGNIRITDLKTLYGVDADIIIQRMQGGAIGFSGTLGGISIKGNKYSISIRTEQSISLDTLKMVLGAQAGITIED